MLICGDFSASVNPRVRDLTGLAISVTFGGLGATSLKLSGYPGLVYDEINDTFLAFYYNGSVIDVRRVNASTWNVDDPTVTGTKPSARTNGIQNSAQYVPELGGVAIANSYTGNVQFLKTGIVSGGPPPTAPAGLTICQER